MLLFATLWYWKVWFVCKTCYTSNSKSKPGLSKNCVFFNWQSINSTCYIHSKLALLKLWQNEETFWDNFFRCDFKSIKRETPQSWLLYCLLESSHFILCVCLDETPLEPIWTFELCSGHFECFLFGTAVWLAETVIKIFGCQSKRNGLALWWAIIRKRSWREKKNLWMLKSDEKNVCGIPYFGSLCS